MKSSYVGGVLFIVGTSIGAGMLALPIANAAIGFWPSSCLLIFYWFLMTLSALYMVEASLYVPAGKHLLSMAEATLGAPGLLVAWVSYMLLLYALLAAFISGGADVLGGFFQGLAYPMPPWVMITGWTLVLGAVVYQGIRPVDWVNRLFMFAKLIIFALLVALIFPQTDSTLLTTQLGAYDPKMSMILITSFGFAIIVPNLRDYFNGNALVLKRVVWIGSLIPLLCYIVWDAVILGTVPVGGEQGLIALQHSAHATSDLAAALSHQVNRPLITVLFNVFTAVCMVTAFLGVSLSLMSFLADGLKLAPYGKEGAGLWLLTFLPPWAAVMFYPGAYLNALSYAGDCCVVLLLFLPAAMVFFARSHLNTQGWKMPGGRGLQGFVMVSAVGILVHEWIW
ncbi:MAG: tryptophan/tyrosine permease [Gammaproteobacteria bacterium]|nr:tryptophan/tyrosine permease [Gammaproteobacteria bacterium]